MTPRTRTHPFATIPMMLDAHNRDVRRARRAQIFDRVLWFLAVCAAYIGAAFVFTLILAERLF